MVVRPRRIRLARRLGAPQAVAGRFLQRSDLSRKFGGPGRNRTGIRGFAVRCITTLPPDPRGAGGGLWFADAFWVKTRSAAERRIVWLRGWGLIPISASADWYARGVAWGQGMRPCAKSIRYQPVVRWRESQSFDGLVSVGRRARMTAGRTCRLQGAAATRRGGRRGDAGQSVIFLGGYFLRRLFSWAIIFWAAGNLPASAYGRRRWQVHRRHIAGPRGRGPCLSPPGRRSIRAEHSAGGEERWRHEPRRPSPEVPAPANSSADDRLAQGLWPTSQGSMPLQRSCWTLPSGDRWSSRYPSLVLSNASWPVRAWGRQA
jgi:hypothetical protein